MSRRDGRSRGRCDVGPGVLGAIRTRPESDDLVAFRDEQDSERFVDGVGLVGGKGDAHVC